jgi:hypothetical protein
MVIVITQFDSLAHVHSVYEDEELALLHFLPIEVLYVCVFKGLSSLMHTCLGITNV